MATTDVQVSYRIRRAWLMHLALRLAYALLSRVRHEVRIGSGQWQRIPLRVDITVRDTDG